MADAHLSTCSWFSPANWRPNICRECFAPRNAHSEEALLSSLAAGGSHGGSADDACSTFVANQLHPRKCRNCSQPKLAHIFPPPGRNISCRSLRRLKSSQGKSTEESIRRRSTSLVTSNSMDALMCSTFDPTAWRPAVCRHCFRLKSAHTFTASRSAKVRSMTRSYFRALQDGWQVIKHCRMIVCGPGRVGKTSFIRSLLKVAFSEDLDSTAGAELRKVWCAVFGTEPGCNYTWKETDEDDQLYMLLSKLLSKVVEEGASGSADKAEGGHEREEVEHKTSTISDLYSSVRSNKALESGFRRKLNLSPAEDLEARLITNVIEKVMSKQSELDELLHDQDICFVDIWDLAGQICFAALQHLLMAAVRSLYVVLFDSSLKLQEKYPSLFRFDGETCIEPYGGSTNVENLERWLNVIHQVTARKGTTFIVGSKIDKIAPSERSCKKETLKNSLWDITKGKPYEHNIEDVFFVDNTLSGKEEEDAAVVELRQRLIDQMLKQPEFNERVPLRWLRFTIIIRYLAKKGQPWLALDSARTLAKQACQTIDDDEVTALLQFHHDLGFIFHYSQNPMLHSKVIIDTAWLLEVVAALFVPRPKRVQDNYFRNQFDLLRDRGVLMESLARHIWQTSGDHVAKYTETVEQRSFFFHLMECYALLCDGETTPIDKEPPSKKFIVPSLISKQASVKRNHATPMAGCPPPIYLYVGAKVIFPQTLFWSLIVHCLQEWVLGPDRMAALHLYRDEARILYQQHVWVILHYFLHGIQISVEPVLDLRHQTPIDEVCLPVQDFLNTTLLQLRNDRFKQLHWSYTAQCWCDLYVKEQCPRHDQYSCPNVDCYHFVEFKEAVPCCNEDQSVQNTHGVERFWRCTGQVVESRTVADNPKTHPTGSQATSVGHNLAGFRENSLDSGRNDATTNAWSTWPFFTLDLIDDLHSEQSLKKDSSRTAKSLSTRPFAGSSFPIARPVKEAREREIPYLPCQTVCGVIGENGAMLQLGSVKAKYPADALPLHSRVAMMSMEIEPGFRLDGEVAFSPQVSIGPHCRCHLDKPVTLSLPLKVDKEMHVTALVSKTAAGLAADWEMVPASDIQVFDDYVEVTANANCIYQVQCSCKYIIKPGMEYTYFSISNKPQPSINTLLLRCSDSQEVCTRKYGDYQLCHHPDETIRIRAVHGDALRISLTSVGQRAIKQFNTPFHISKPLNCTLDEQFNISVGPTASDYSAEMSSEEEQHDYSKLYWRTELADLTSTPGFTSDVVDGEGELMVQSSKLSELEVPETPSPDSLTCQKCHELRDVSGFVKYLSFLVKQDSQVQHVQNDSSGLQAARSLPSSSLRHGKISHVQESAGGRKLMLKIFDSLSKDFESTSLCDSLAVHLNLTTDEHDFVQDFKRHHSDERNDHCYIARQIMRKWLREDDDAKTWPASRCLDFLCTVLDEDMGRKDLKKKCFALWQYHLPMAVALSSKVGPERPVASGHELMAKASASEPIDDPQKTAQPSLALLMKVSKAISDRWACIQLAIALDIGDENVLKVESGSSTHELVFTRILRTWQVVKGLSATKNALFKALQEVDSPGMNLAELFRQDFVK